jgi:hypothetical protein
MPRTTREKAPLLVANAQWIVKPSSDEHHKPPRGANLWTLTRHVAASISSESNPLAHAGDIAGLADGKERARPYGSGLPP